MNTKINTIANDIESVYKQLLNASFEIHKSLGPGLLENAYEECLVYELKNRGIKVERQKGLPLIYKDVQLETGYRIDLLVEDEIVVELKVCESLTDVHLAQILTYMKLSECKLGLLINFNVKYLKQGIKRVIL
ncbi:GxxExxY protein [Plebeiibacterium marinum]|uniref:GxxExxY protein n=1 Tax=Plebeiibacterium marinum TaxID=2992111 RepID=A0AAE3MCT5_9BACT|nr:GxxExxY protein [Plebeiobacterium marinum]MCW3805408.1 GxxExxY protein [Plebeiobacterium marinum]